MTVRHCRKKTCSQFFSATAYPSGQISLDFCVNQTDNNSVTVALDLIYSPPDMPEGLWRGFAFIGNAGRVGHAR